MPQINCPHCGQQFDLTDEQAPQYAGQTITCTKCQRPFTVPGTPSMPVPPLGVGYAGPQVYAAQKANPLAIVSLVLAIVGLIIPFLPSMIAIILGIIGLRKTRDPQVGGKGLAIAGISAGAATFLMGTCLISILLPSLNRARETANRVKCASNMRQMGQALLLYAQEHHGHYPQRFEQLIAAEPIGIDVFVCPSSNDTTAPNVQTLSSGGHDSYIYITGLSPSASADTIVVYEPLTNHADGINALFGDGHVEFLPRGMAQQVISQLQAGHNPPNMRGPIGQLIGPSPMSETNQPSTTPGTDAVLNSIPAMAAANFGSISALTPPKGGFASDDAFSLTVPTASIPIPETFPASMTRNGFVNVPIPRIPAYRDMVGVRYVGPHSAFVSPSNATAHGPPPPQTRAPTR